MRFGEVQRILKRVKIEKSMRSGAVQRILKRGKWEKV